MTVQILNMLGTFSFSMTCIVKFYCWIPPHVYCLFSSRFSRKCISMPTPNKLPTSHCTSHNKIVNGTCRNVSKFNFRLCCYASSLDGAPHMFSSHVYKYSIKPNRSIYSHFTITPKIICYNIYQLRIWGALY